MRTEQLAAAAAGLVVLAIAVSPLALIALARKVAHRG